MIWLAWFVILIADAYFNYLRMMKGGINHYVNGAYRIAIAVLFVWLFRVREPLQIMCFVLGGFFSFWLLFNLILNFFNRKPWDYIGKSAWLDKLEAIAPLFVIWCKLVLAIGFIYGYYNYQLF